ncbi:MAG: radical SAM protein [Sandaracinaceae bacterium]|nr:radical SAM protein [Sandaracinaceae bacterium]
MCDACLAPSPGALVLDGGAVYHEKRCATHDPRRWRISDNGEAYARYDRHYHALFPLDAAPAPPVDSYFAITNRCNQACDYCCVEANRFGYYGDYELSRFAAELPRLASRKVGLVGGEPLLHPRFFDFAREIEAAGRTTVVFTNGLRLADDAVVRRLVEVTRGRLIVRMTLEGFADEDYAHLRIPRAREKKLAALANLERRAVATTIGHTIVQAEREDRPRLRRVIRAIVEHAMGHRFVTGVTFAAVAALGGSARRAARRGDVGRPGHGRDPPEPPPSRCRGATSTCRRRSPSASRASSGCRCASTTRRRSCSAPGTVGARSATTSTAHGSRPGSTRVARGPEGRAALAAGLAADLLASSRPAELPGLARLGLSIAPLFLRRLDYREIPEDILPINAGTVCDPHNFDASVARRCEKGAASTVGDRIVRETVSQMVMRQVAERG